ncbi:hypothetical protein GCM10009869_06900 [Amnibacterium kyonggiense]
MRIVNRTAGPAISPGSAAAPVTASIFVTLTPSSFLITAGVDCVIGAAFVACGVGAERTVGSAVAEGVELAEGVAVGTGVLVGVGAALEAGAGAADVAGGAGGTAAAVISPTTATITTTARRTPTMITVVRRVGLRRGWSDMGGSFGCQAAGSSARMSRNHFGSASSR